MKNAKFNKLRGNLNQADAKREKNERFYKEFNTSRDCNDQEYNLIKKTVEVARCSEQPLRRETWASKEKTFLESVYPKRYSASVKKQKVLTTTTLLKKRN